MEAKKMKLLDFIGSNKKTFNVPVYQRNYEWKEEHCRRLFEDVESIAAENFLYCHFLGPIVYISGDITPNFMEFIIIDGQQRITSTMLLLIALQEKITAVNLKEDIRASYLFNERVDEKYRIKLKPVKNDMPAYEGILNNTTQVKNSNIYRNYELFQQLIYDCKYSPEDIFKALCFVEIVYIQLEKDKKSENPQLIFESLNSTGKKLEPSDLIRNYLLMNHDYETQNMLYNDYWLTIENLIPNSLISSFVRDFITMKTGSIPKKELVYEKFKDYCKKEPNFSEANILIDLVPYSEYYSWLMNANCPNEHVNNLIMHLNYIKSTIVYPLLLLLIKECYLTKTLKIPELVNIMRFINFYIFRRNVCRMQASSLSSIFATLCKDIKESKPTDYYEFICTQILSKSGSGQFPDDETFKNSFIMKDFYNSKIAKEFLMSAERLLRKEVVDSTNLQIEHIMPQKLSPSWQIYLGKKYEEIHIKYIHTIGNLTITAYNQEMSNHMFDDKKEFYKDSNLYLTRNLSYYPAWNEASILKRAGELFEIAKVIWSIPSEYLPKQKSETINYDEDFNIMEDINVTGLKPKRIIINDAITNVSTWKEMLIVVCSYFYEEDKEKFQMLTRNKLLKNGNKRIIDTQLTNNQYKIDDDLYLDSNLSALQVMNYCKIMAEYFELQEYVYYTLRRK